jgi:hypothetical protein
MRAQDIQTKSKKCDARGRKRGSIQCRSPAPQGSRGKGKKENKSKPRKETAQNGDINYRKINSTVR